MALESQPTNSTQCYVLIDDQADATPVVAYFVTTTTCANITTLPIATEPQVARRHREAHLLPGTLASFIAR